MYTRICTKWLEENACKSEDRLTTLYIIGTSGSCYSAQQLLVSMPYMPCAVICTLTKLQVISPSYTTSVTLILLSHQEREANFSGKLHSICLTSCEAICDSIVSHDTVKGIACETSLELWWIFSFTASLAVWLTPRAKRTCLLAFLDVRNAISPCLRFCCANNRIKISFLCVQINWSTKISIFFQKSGVYELIGWMNY